MFYYKLTFLKMKNSWVLVTAGDSCLSKGKNVKWNMSWFCFGSQWGHNFFPHTISFKQWDRYFCCCYLKLKYMGTMISRNGKGSYKEAIYWSSLKPCVITLTARKLQEPTYHAGIGIAKGSQRWSGSAFQNLHWPLNKNPCWFWAQDSVPSSKMLYRQWPQWYFQNHHNLGTPPTNTFTIFRLYLERK